ncbi:MULTISPECIES: hypothetical protein [Ralstonia]|jgi:hypothetical protein|uniref:Uncharacterized protein n=1 Tax=Ralstonia pickettii OR214 TaxID=1264675 RepID=R0CEE2_RALPI|nr:MULTISPECIES: hypothetical protein [Ralstonia]MEA3270412.1 hypothetical protein [Pseudomonadota bacterium]ENZ75281.1 hypothetical protein OR214_04723 [Ralstonia pickettii OR214]MBL4778861.1 hypothetical protein [Ralstonia sp.]MCM3583636.1 hypothetical protein [Ralstonia pickettii]OCS46903.1 hypothetical protein BEK67_03505 [Ralstonia pickettii]
MKKFKSVIPFSKDENFGNRTVIQYKIKAKIGDNAFSIAHYITPTAKFEAILVANTREMTGIGIVAKQHLHTLEALHASPGELEIVEEPEYYEGVEVPPHLAAFMMIALHHPEMLGRKGYAVFGINVTDKQ